MLFRPFKNILSVFFEAQSGVKIDTQILETAYLLNNAIIVMYKQVAAELR